MEMSPPTITSRDNRWLKQFRAALQGASPREGEFLGVEGAKLVEEALRSGLVAEALLVSPSGERHIERLPVSADKDGNTSDPAPRVLRTTDRLFASIAGTEAPQGIAGLFPPPKWTFDDLLRGDVPLVVVLAGVQDPGNVGTILRSVEAFGATGAATTRGTADPWSPKALRASAGSAFRVPLLRGMAAPVLLAQLRVANLRIFATRSHVEEGRARTAGPSADLREPCAIFVGNEGSGLPLEIERAADATLEIPMRGAVESLNAGVAASVFLFEAARVRSKT